ncbi:hypothetical protein RB595_002773 [Gaeumannomyces hyphopodioides]
MEDVIRTLMRLLQLLWVVLLTALIGNVIALNVGAAPSAQAAVNFAMFVAVVAWIATLYGLVTHYISTLFSPAVAMVLDSAATLFTFIAGVALAAKLKVTSCGGALDPRDLGTDWIGFGSADDTKRCREIQASAVFLWFLFFCFCVSLFFTFRTFRRAGGGSVLSSAPTMSQLRV